MFSVYIALIPAFDRYWMMSLGRPGNVLIF